MGRSKLTFLGAMGIFGTIGIFVKYIPLSSAAIAFFRGLLGVVFLGAAILVGKKKLHTAVLRQNLPALCLSGIAIGINWILLFESYRYTTVATATVCYYLAPVFLLLAAPMLGEKLTPRKLCCIALALVGLVFVSGMMENGLPTFREAKGILAGVGAAILYATVMLLNKKFPAIPAYDKTIVQLGFSTAVLLPYMLLTQGLAMPQLSPVQWLLLLTVGIVHTGVAYAMYFSAITNLRAHSIAIFSYLDPVIAIILSALLLKEPMGTWGILGSVLILGSALYSELPSHP